MENLFLLSIEINTDIFEANVINIIILVAGLFNVVGAALKTAMLERKTKILNEVQGAEQSLTAATERLREAEEQAGQSSLIITKIEEKTEKLRDQILTSNWNRAYEEMQRIEKASNLALKYETQKAARENQDNLLTAGLTNAYTYIINELSYDECCKLNTKRIAQIPTVV
jgi:F-type H+-transporting ATPase subunit b|tara:strand:- start:435 stop:944 length:510 start_codon:yes stop_codon:yes gene_type:complete